MARFKVSDIFFIRGRNITVVAGKIIEGQFRVGDCTNIPQLTDIPLSNRIVGIELIKVLGDSGVIGLAFACNSDEERSAWKQLDLYDKEVDITGCS